MSSRSRTLTVFFVAAVAGVGAGCGHEEPQQAEATLEPVEVAVAAVEPLREEHAIEVRGVVQPARRADVSSRVMGPVVSLRVGAGSIARKGETMLEIEPEAAQGQLAQARGAEAQAEAALALAERNHERFKALRAENAASELELDVARMQLEQARGAVEQAAGAVQTAQTVAEESAVKAPFAARVIETLVEVGDLAAPGRPLVRIESLGDPEIWLTVPARDAGRIAIDDRLVVHIDARPELGPLTGVVKEIVPSADPATHTVTIKVGLPGAAVPSGFSGRAVIAGDIADKLVVPASAVHRRGGLELVVVRSADGTARTRAVTTGSTLPDGRVEVLSGLDAGDEVAVNAPGPVADGTPLEIQR